MFTHKSVTADRLEFQLSYHNRRTSQGQGHMKSRTLYTPCGNVSETVKDRHCQGLK